MRALTHFVANTVRTNEAPPITFVLTSQILQYNLVHISAERKHVAIEDNLGHFQNPVTIKSTCDTKAHFGIKRFTGGKQILVPSILRGTQTTGQLVTRVIWHSGQ